MKEKLRIAMLGHKRVPSREGGIEIVVEELGARLCSRGHEVVCYNRRGDHVSGKEHNEARMTSWRGMQLRYVPTIDKKGIAAVTSSVCAAFCAAFGRYDVVHFHAEGPSAMLWLPKLMGKRCICTVHGLDHRSQKWQGSFGKKYILFGERVAVRFADEIIVLSPGIQAYFEETYGRETVVIPNGVNRPQRRGPDEITRRFGLHEGDYILFLGRIVPGKGVDYLIDAYRGMHTDKKLVIAGGSSDSRAYMEQLRAQAAQDARIVFTDFVQGPVLDELYTNCYAYVLPSDSEGMPLSLLEAMSYGACCVTSDIPECAQVVGTHGVTFPRGSVEGLRDTLQALCDEPDTARRYREASADYILRAYSWEETTEKTLALYRGVTAGGAKASREERQ